MRGSLLMPDDLVKVHCDASSLRGLISYLIKRHAGSTRQVPLLHFFMAKVWHVMGLGLSVPHGFEPWIAKDPRIQALYDLIGEHFWVESTGKEQSPEHDEDQCQIELAESDIDDEALALELGASVPQKPEALSSGSASSESLHTGLTAELEDKLRISEPGVSIEADPASSPLKENKAVIMIADSPVVKPKHEGKRFQPESESDKKKKRILELRRGFM